MPSRIQASPLLHEVIVLIFLAVHFAAGCGEDAVEEKPATPVTYNELVRGCIAATACGVLAYPRVSDCVEAYYNLHKTFGVSRMYDAKYHCVNGSNGDCDEVFRCMGTNRLAGLCDGTFKARCEGTSAVSCDLLDKRVFVHECGQAGLECAVKDTQSFEASCAFGTCISGYKPRCEEGKVLKCVDGVILVEDCDAQEKVCGATSSNAKGCVGNTSTSCTPGQHEDKCQGNSAVSCQQGMVHKVDCAAKLFNRRCMGGQCVPTGTACLGSVDRCNEDKLEYCLDGNWVTFDCGKLGFGACRTVTHGARCGLTI